MTKNFTTPEILNKYRHTDKNIDDKIKQEEINKEKYENLDKIINKNIDKLKTKPTNDFATNYNYDDDNTISVLDKTDYDYDNVFQKFINKIINLIMMKIY